MSNLTSRCPDETLDCIRKGREAYARRAWHDAYRFLHFADEATALAADDLERLATAACLIGREPEYLRLLECLYRIHLEAGDWERAARSTFWLAMFSLLQGDVGRSNAWGARGHRLVQERDCAERGYLLLLTATEQSRAGHVESAQETAAKAVAIGERCQDADLTAAARCAQGRALMRQSQVAPGLTLLDETMLTVVAGELSPMITGMVYCSVIEACREVHEFRRAREWTLALSRWCEQQSEVMAFTSVCLLHRAEIMQFHGAWSEALAEAGRACESPSPSRRLTGAAHYQQAEIHRLQGDAVKADEAYRRASQLGYEPHPGLALLRLAQGHTDAASAAIRRVVMATTDRLQRAKLLPAYVEIALATSQVEEARSACEELQGLAETFDTDALRAVAAQAAGVLALADANARAAIGPLRQAFELWERLDAPYEMARARALVGQACLALGDEEAAALEFDAARCAFAELGAPLDLSRLESKPATPSPRCPLTARELHVLRLITVGRTNKEIASELRLSQRTIDRHVSNILRKLDVRSRTAATAYAYDHGLI